jgi:long-chain acyl-CoA synthetase
VLQSGEKVHPDELEENLARSDLVADVSIVERTERDKPLVSAILHPNVEAARALLRATGESLDETTLRKLVASEVERLGRGLAAYKRIGRIELADEPLPKTPLRKVARGQLRDAYDFNFEHWLKSEGEGP